MVLRNTFTLPLWLRIFPDAKVVYIELHGVDVAQSLRVRSRKGFVNSTRKYRRYRPIVSLRPKRGGFIAPPRCASLEGGFSLWQKYTDQVMEMMQQLPNNRALKLCYEQVLEGPVPHLRVNSESCVRDVSNQKHEAMKAGMNDSRAYSNLNDPELRDFARDYQVGVADRDRGYK